LPTEAVWKLVDFENLMAPGRLTGVIVGAVHRRPGPNAERSLPRTAGRLDPLVTHLAVDALVTELDGGLHGG
jgi:hypothetical protein